MRKGGEVEISPDVLSRLTRLGYLQTPTCYLTGEDIARYREAWRGSFEGRVSILWAMLYEMCDNVLRGAARWNRNSA